MFGKPNIVKMEQNKDIEGLIKALIYEKDDKIRSDAAVALSHIGDLRAVEPLLRATNDSDHRVRSVAAVAINDIRKNHSKEDGEKTVRPEKGAISSNNSAIESKVEKKTEGGHPKDVWGGSEPIDGRVDDTKKRSITVFVSSTFRDMQAERDDLLEEDFSELRKICEQRDVTWGEVDLRWGITDDEKAEGKVLPICLAEIDRCRPYFIGMLGERSGYGSCGSFALFCQLDFINSR